MADDKKNIPEAAPPAEAPGPVKIYAQNCLQAPAE